MRSASIFALLLLIVAAGAFLLRGGFDPIEPAPAAVPSRSVPEVERGEPSSAPAPADTRHEAAQAPAGSAELDRATHDGVLRGVVLDFARRPIAGALVRAERRPAAGYHLLDHDRAALVVERVQTQTDAAGEFALELVDARPRDLHVVAAGFAAEVLAQRRAGEYVEVLLGVGATLYGRVTRTGNGDPVEQAEVRLRPEWLEGRVRDRRIRRATRSDANGTWRIEAIPAGRYRLSIEPRTASTAHSMPVELSAGQNLRQDVELEPGCTLRGRVVDARTGDPLAGAEVAPGWRFEQSVRTNELGEYELPGFAGNTLAARAPGYGGMQVRFAERPSNHALLVQDFQLERARIARGRLVDTLGAPVVGAYVAATATERRGTPTVQHVDWIAGKSDTQGRFVLGPLRSDMAHTLFAQHDGLAALVIDFPEREQVSTVVELGELVMGAGGSIQGEIVDERDQPYPNWTIQLTGRGADRARLRGTPREEDRLLDSYLCERTARTDDRGHFRFDDLPPGVWTLRSGLNPMRPTTELRVELTPEERERWARVELFRGLSIAGRVETSDSGELPTVYISVDPEHGGTATDVEVARDGSFEAVGLEEGAYTLSIYPYPSDEDERDGRGFATQRLRSVQAGRRDVVIVLRLVPR